MSNKSHPVYFTKRKFESFSRAFAEAKASQKESFGFEGRIYDTTYAKYLIEYLSPRFA